MLIIFDCDGVVVDSMQLHAKAEAAYYNQLGIKITEEELVNRFAGISDAKVSRALSIEHGIRIPTDFQEQLDSLKTRLFDGALAATTGVRSALDALSDVERCIASGSSHVLLDRMLTITGLQEYFAPHIFSSQQVEYGKPYPDLFLYAADSMGWKAADCIVVEDSVSGIIAANAADMKALGYVGAAHATAPLASELQAVGADVVFTHMDELPEIIDAVAQSSRR